MKVHSALTMSPIARQSSTPSSALASTDEVSASADNGYLKVPLRGVAVAAGAVALRALRRLPLSLRSRTPTRFRLSHLLLPLSHSSLS